jgi:hypothetical protein
MTPIPVAKSVLSLAVYPKCTSRYGQKTMKKEEVKSGNLI